MSGSRSSIKLIVRAHQFFKMKVIKYTLIRLFRSYIKL